MGYVALLLALSGFAIGALFRLQVLMVAIALILPVSIVFCFGSGLSFLYSLLTIMTVQTIIQGSYFLGLLAHGALASHGQRRPIL